MNNEGDNRIDDWAEIEELIAREAEKSFTEQMFDQDRAKAYALEFAATIVSGICSMLPGARLYVPKLPTHHREARDEQIRMNFNGDCKDAAREARLSVRQTRRIVSAK